MTPVVADIAQVARGGVSVTTNFLAPEVALALREDARALLMAGAFVGGGLRLPEDRRRPRRRRRRRDEDDGDDSTTTTFDNRTRLCDVCGIFDDAEDVDDGVGDRDARDGLLDVVSDLREMLMGAGIELSENMELQYLHYPGADDGDGARGDRGETGNGGFYRRHFDRIGNEDGPLARRVSLLLYLNEDGWDAAMDGGMLRAYVRQSKGRDGELDDEDNDNDDGDTRRCAERVVRVLDILPEGGKLVLFDSAAVEHEVLPTRRERWAVVGWFLTEKGLSVTEIGRRGGGREERARRIGGEVQTKNAPRKKKRNRTKRKRASR
jgi:hypothetical protein